MKRLITIIVLFFSFLGGFYVVSSCKKKITIPELVTTMVSNVTSTAAISGGTITDDGGATVVASGVCYSTAPGPDIDGNKTLNGPAETSFASQITGLSPNTTYYIRAYATNSGGTGYGNELSFTTSSAANTVTDIDGNVYHFVTIGTQTWMVENLKTIHYRNGDPVPNVTGNAAWMNLTTGAYCDYNNSSSYRDPYGVYYNWYVVNDSRNIAPLGWHVPSYAEYNTLVSYLGGTSVAGGKLKETGFDHWNSPNTGATNETGFTSVGNHGRNYDGIFYPLGQYGQLWCTTDIDVTSAHAWGARYNDAVFSHGGNNKKDGFCVRCIRD